MKSLLDNFNVTIRDGELMLVQRCSDIRAIVDIILYTVVDDVTEEECDVLLKATDILRKYDK